MAIFFKTKGWLEQTTKSAYPAFLAVADYAILSHYNAISADGGTFTESQY
jgi:hypothetical protein